MLHALNAASAATAEAERPSHDSWVDASKPGQHVAASKGRTSVPGASNAGDAHPIEESSEAFDNAGQSNIGNELDSASSRGDKRREEHHGSKPTPHHLTPNRVTLARIGSVAQEQMEHKMRKARQGSIEKHVMQHDMFQGGGEPAHTVHQPDAIPESFQEPTLAAILRESALAEDLVRREADKAARAADTSLPLFLTTSSSPESTSRQHSRSFGPMASSSRPNSRPVSRPVSAANTMTRRQLASELSSGLDSLPRQMSRLQSARDKRGAVKEAFSPSTTGRLASASSSLQVCCALALLLFEFFILEPCSLFLPSAVWEVIFALPLCSRGTGK